MLKQLLLLIVSVLWMGYLPARQNEGPAILPQPKKIAFTSTDFIITGATTVIAGASAEDRFAAKDLTDFIQQKFDISLTQARAAHGPSIILKRIKDKELGAEGYRLTADANHFIISATSAAGLFYGVQTAKQIIQKNGSQIEVKGINISDWPDTKYRAAHYDTKHHQDSKEYVQAFIRELAQYKINMLIWEWEDKFLYPSHPEIGAPGAFTMQEMQELTRYAHQYHVQLVPLVQGLGHVSFILKWPQFAHLREVAASNFEFCPLKDGSYQLLMDLWKDAMEATPGSSFIHIGSDETYELGACANCSKKIKEIGRSGLFHHFLGTSTRLLKPYGRGVMNWEAPMGWAKSRLSVYHGNEQEAAFKVIPEKGMILTESYDYETDDLKYARQAKALGYPVFAYDPNPGIEMLFLPYFFTKSDRQGIRPGALQNSYEFLVKNLGKAVFDGVIRTSWDDAGLPMQAWMLCFATTAAYSWNVNGPSLQDFPSLFYQNRYGANAAGIDSLYFLLNEAAYFYMESFERKVWHYGEIGKTHLPDLPRGDALEYDPYWATEYKERIEQARLFKAKMDTAVTICDRNLASAIDNRYDVEVFKTLCKLALHTANTYLELEKLEHYIKTAHQQRYIDVDTVYYNLEQAEKIVQHNLDERRNVFSDICLVWEKTRLPKGLSTAGKQYFFEQDRTRHFANRTAGMNYLIYDEEKLGLEDYLKNLQDYMLFFKNRFIRQKN